jgi:hypothetical protein
MDGEVTAMKTKRRMAKRLPGKRLKRPVPKRLSRRHVSHSRTSIGRHPDYVAGVSDGASWRSGEAHEASLDRLRQAVHLRWNRRFNETTRVKEVEWKLVQQRGRKYAAGFLRGAGLSAHLSLVPLRNKAAAVVFAGTGETALQEVLLQLGALPLHEIVIVLSNPTEAMYSLSRSYGNTVIAHLPGEVDPDVGRALGAKLTDADTVLFVDGKHAVEANDLASFLWECDGRVDIALNDLSARMGSFHKRSRSSRIHEFLNVSLNRGDLRTNSLSALPFALSRHALDTLGSSALAVPVKAHALAILSGLRIGARGRAGSRAVDEGSDMDGNWRKAAGDHAEAWREAMIARGSRLQFFDSIRNRRVLEDVEK